MATSLRPAALLVFLLCLCPEAGAQGSTGSASVEKPDQPSIDQVKSELWSREQAIYAGRGRGDPRPYIESTAAHYMAWPPQMDTPVAAGKLLQTVNAMASKEKLTMELVDFTLHDDAAIIYYRTHRTVRPDGTATDEFFETTHTWVREGDAWKLLGGMARLQPERK